MSKLTRAEKQALLYGVCKSPNGKIQETCDSPPYPCHHQGVRDPCSCPKEACPSRFSLEPGSRRAKDGNILTKLRIISVPFHCQLISRKGSIRCNWNFCLVDRYRCATCYQPPRTLPNLGWEILENETNVPILPFPFTSQAELKLFMHMTSH